MSKAIVLAIAIIVALQGAAKPGGLLRPGTVLVYSTGGVETSWTIDSVAADTTLGGRTGCVRLRLRTSPQQRESSVRAWCVDGATLTTWDDRTGAHRPARPAAAGSRLELKSGANTVRFETGAMSVDTIGGVAIPVVPTVVVTRDSSGAAVRRLRERFSAGLLTATSGVFEVPDTSRSGAWREERRFTLVAIRQPSAH